MVELRGVSKQYDDFVLNPTDLRLNRGEFFSLVGPSGCGKTTILKLIGGFLKPTVGSLWLGDREITDLPPYRRNIHTVFQRYALFPHLDVFENVAFSLRIQKLPETEVETRVRESLEMMEIGALEKRRIQNLSGGQAQRVALARALVARPELVLLDEPLSALDAALRLRMRQELRSICRRAGCTFLLVTHDQEEALQLSDRMAVIFRGGIRQLGTPFELYDAPVDAEVARFLGPTNELIAQIVGDTPDLVTLETALGKFDAPKRAMRGPLSNKVRFVIRPEKLRLTASQPAQGGYPGVVVETQYLGARTEYVVECQGVRLAVVDSVIRKVPFSVGSKVWISWNREDSLVFVES